MIDIDENDRRVWEIITDVPALKAPWQYVCFILNVLIPGKHHSLSLTVRLGHYDSELFLCKVEQDLIHGRRFPIVPGLHPHRLDLLHLLGLSHCVEESAR